MKTSQTTTKAPTTFNNYKIYANFPFSFFSSFSMCHEVCTVAETQRPSFSLGNTENAHIQICAKLLKSLFSGIRPNTNKQNKTNETVCGKKWNRLAGGGCLRTRSRRAAFCHKHKDTGYLYIWNTEQWQLPWKWPLE